jgi:hypothetical protein
LLECVYFIAALLLLILWFRHLSSVFLRQPRRWCYGDDRYRGLFRFCVDFIFAFGVCFEVPIFTVVAVWTDFTTVESLV